MSQDAKISVDEGNAKIAKFMGCEFGHDFWAGTGNYFFPNDKATADELKFHSSWDWLMPVYKKLTSLNRLFVTSQRLHWQKRIGLIIHWLIEADIKNAFDETVKTIEWVNEEEKIERIGKGERRYGNRAWE